jgi:hypothetical protein
MGSAIYSWRKGKGMFTFYGGHDQKIFSIRWEAPTVLDLHPNSPGYRLILNNVFCFLPERKNKDPN